MISQFFVISLRGDTIIHKDCKYTRPWPLISQNGLRCGKVYDNLGHLLIKSGNQQFVSRR
jgi:hypothetical protein